MVGNRHFLLPIPILLTSFRRQKNELNGSPGIREMSDASSHENPEPEVPVRTSEAHSSFTQSASLQEVPGMWDTVIYMIILSLKEFTVFREKWTHEQLL